MAAPYSLHPLTEAPLSLRLRYRLRRAGRAQRTGLLMYALIRTPVRGVTWSSCVVSVREGENRLCRASPYSKRPKWVPLPAGRHRLEFSVAHAWTSSSFRREVDLAAGEVLLVVCWPIQPWTVFGPSPSSDRWYVGTVDRAVRSR